MGFLQGSVRPPGQARIRRARAVLGGLLLAASASGCGALASASASGLPAKSSSGPSATSASGPPAKSASGPSATAAQRVLAQALMSHRSIHSGVVGLDLRVVPQGSATVAGPVDLSVAGPFQSPGPGHVPALDLTVAMQAQGRRGSLQLISVGGHAYLTLGGQSFLLPASSYRRLASELRSLSPSATGRPGGGSGALTPLGSDPLRWLEHPRIVGHPRLAGTPTTEVAARLDPTGLLRDLDRTLRRAGSLGISGAGTLAKRLSAATSSRLTRALGAPRLDVWIGSADGVLRRLRLAAEMPISPSMRAGLGGARSAAVTLNLRYSQIDQPQAITAPAVTQPFGVFRAEALLLLQQVEAGLKGSSPGTSTTGG